MVHLKLFEDIRYGNDILLIPSGEVITVSDSDLDTVESFLELEFDADLNSYKIDDNYKSVVITILENSR